MWWNARAPSLSVDASPKQVAARSDLVLQVDKDHHDLPKAIGRRYEFISTFHDRKHMRRKEKLLARAIFSVSTPPTLPPSSLAVLVS